ncbi:MAG: energy-coupling factor ABC transporter ATP-binding protein [Methanospirillum sp.]|nr:energy-coupling factor ABC transporter ATP-binding protein [Methanospirillum sp.]
MIRITSLEAGILDIPSLAISPGRCVITGPNGSGKTTFLTVLAGIRPPETGAILIDGKNPADCTIGWVGEYPERNILFTRVFDEIASPLRFSGENTDTTRDLVEETAASLKISSLLLRETRSLSGGEKVLVSFATALIKKPDLLLLDETDSHLDEEFCRRIDGIMQRFHVRYVLFSSHQPVRMATADEIISLEKGEVVRICGINACPPRKEHLSDPGFWRKVLQSQGYPDRRPSEDARIT